jgi:hypothetical protein
MDENRAMFAVELQDGVSSPAAGGEEALARLKRAIVGGSAELRNINGAMARLRAGGESGSAVFRELKDRADAVRKSIGRSQRSFLELGGSLAELNAPLAPLSTSIPRTIGSFGGGVWEQAQEGPKRLADGLAQTLGQASRLPGPLGAIAGQLGRVLSVGSPAALAVAGLAAVSLALVAALAAMYTAVINATVALVRYGLAAADARRAERLHLEGVVALHEQLTHTAGSASALGAAIDRVSATSAISRSRVTSLAEQLHRAGLRGSALEDALRGVATVSAVQGEQAADRFRAMAVSAYRTRGSVRALVGDVERRLGGTARGMAISWDRQMERLQESWQGLFAGIELDGALAALDEVLSMFSATTVTGRALRTIFTSMFQPLVDGVSGAGGPARQLFEGMLIGALSITLAVLRVRNALVRTFGGSASGLASFVDWTSVGIEAATHLGAALLTLAAPFLALAAVVGTIAYGTYRMIVAFRAAEERWATFRESVGGALDGLVQEWRTIGQRAIDGLVRGLLGGITSARQAVTRIGDGMTQALRDALQIRSPSRVFAELGRAIPQGLAAGVQADAGISSRAVEDLATVPFGLGSTATRSPRGGDVYVSIDGIQVVVGSPSDVPTQLGDRIREALEQALIGVLVETGGTTDA